MNRQQHRPQPEFQAVPRHHKAAEQRAKNENRNANIAVDNPKLIVGKLKSADGAEVEQKRMEHLHQLRLTEPVKQNKRQHHDNFWLLEKCPERLEKFREKTL